MADARNAGSVRKRIEFDAETWHALHKLSLDSMRSLQELADEAFRDLLKEHRRPRTLKGRALVRSPPTIVIRCAKMDHRRSGHRRRRIEPAWVTQPLATMPPRSGPSS